MKIELDRKTVRLGLYTERAAIAIGSIIDSVYLWKVVGELVERVPSYRKIIHSQLIGTGNTAVKFLFKWPHCFNEMRCGPFVYRDIDGEVCLELDDTVFDDVFTSSSIGPKVIEDFLLESFKQFAALEENRHISEDAVEICRAFAEDSPLDPKIQGKKLDQIETTAVEVLLDEINRIKITEEGAAATASWQAQQLHNELEKILR